MEIVITGFIVFDYLIITIVFMFALLGLFEWLKPNSSIRGKLKDTKEELKKEEA